MKQSNIDIVLKVLERKSLLVRSFLNIDGDDPFDCENITTLISGLTVVLANFENIDGLIYKINTSTSIIALNSNKTKGQINSILGHELYHYFFSSNGTCICRTDEFDKRDDNEEYLADCFSSMLLASEEAIAKFVNDKCFGVIDKKSVAMMEYYFKMSRKSLLNRLFYLKYITESEIEELSNISDSIIAEAGLPLEFFTKKIGGSITYGYYQKTLSKLLENGKIGDSRYESLLKDATLE